MENWKWWRKKKFLRSGWQLACRSSLGVELIIILGSKFFPLIFLNGRHKVFFSFYEKLKSPQNVGRHAAPEPDYATQGDSTPKVV